MEVVRDLDFPFREKIRTPVVTLGVFDGVHVGHQKVIRETLEEAQRTGADSLVITFDIHPEEVVKGAGPFLITSLEHRLMILDRLGVRFSLVLSFNKRWRECSAESFVKNLLVDRIGVSAVVLGFNCTFGKNAKGNYSLLKGLAGQYGFRALCSEMVLDRGEIVSSTAIRDAILEGNLKKASRMLGRSVSVLGSVVPGEGRGRSLGYPTANLDLHHEARPPEGVYSSIVVLHGKRHGGIASIGRRETFQSGSQGGEAVVEVHIFKYSGDLYGQDLEVQFLEKVREQRRFSSQEVLREAIREDVKRAKRSLKKYLTKKEDFL